jgi:hypothetical protein
MRQQLIENPSTWYPAGVLRRPIVYTYKSTGKDADAAAKIASLILGKPA